MRRMILVLLVAALTVVGAAAAATSGAHFTQGASPSAQTSGYSSNVRPRSPGWAT
jgi:hypothetical protein